MATSTSRQARSARREALKSKLEACNIGTRKISSGKVAKKALKTKASHSKSALQTALGQAQRDHAQREKAQLEQAQLEMAQEEKAQSEEPETIELKPDVQMAASIETPMVSESQTDVRSEEKSDSATPTPEPFLPINDNATDDELQAYLREFEETTLGSCDVATASDTVGVPVARDIEQDQDIFDTKIPGIDLDDDYQMQAYASAVPALDSSDSPTSPEMMPTTPLREDTEPKELGIEDYINYANDTENEPVEVEPVGKSKSKRAFVCLYGTQPFTQPFHCSFNPNKRTLLAAWRTMAPDYLTGPREAYIQSVLLAAASLNQRSMLSGCARQTMSPGLSTSY